MIETSRSKGLPIKTLYKNRNNNQKPDDDFISRFQRTFPNIVSRDDSKGSVQDGSASRFNAGASNHLLNGRYAESTTGPWGAEVDVAHGGYRPIMQSHDEELEDHNMKNTNERTPRNLSDLNFSPFWMDSRSMQMISLAGQRSGLHTPNRVGMGAIFHNQAGDLHTPTVGLHTMIPHTPSSQALVPQHATNLFSHYYMAHQMPDMNPYMPQQSFAPSAFTRRGEYDIKDEAIDDWSINECPIDQASDVSDMTISTNLSTHRVIANPKGVSYAGEKFRYDVSFSAPTAMVKHEREIPVSYLNKGQAYYLTVMDSTPPISSSEPHRYRTFVRVSFEEEQQRLRPASCWQLWEQGRGTAESHKRDGKLLAVEYVDPPQGSEDHKTRQLQIEQISFDGFCVIWTANPATSTPDCTIPVRFNFLSTDFSHSKGVKGIPVRLCVKTELLSPREEADGSRESEVCYFKVKLFRDHGAERKLSNDIAHVKKTIEKLKQQIAQVEKKGGYGKRKRARNAVADMKTANRSKHSSKYRRIWSNGSQNGSEKFSLEDDPQAKLAMMQGMFFSNRSISILALRGEEEDDPDLHPVQLLVGHLMKPNPLSQHEHSAAQSMESWISQPSSSNPSLYSPRLGSTQFMEKKDVSIIPQVSSGDRVSQGFIEVLDIDSTYRPPAERPRKPIACFYVCFMGNEFDLQEYYYAIYLNERTVRDLTRKISEKRHIDPSRIARILHVNEAGLRIMVDDDMVRELPECLDMIVDIYATSNNDVSSPDSPDPPLEIKLIYSYRPA